MKKMLVLMAFIGAAVVLAGPRLVPAYYHRMDNCAANGSTNTTVTQAGDYLMTVTGETTNLCVGAASCAADGHPFVTGFSMRMMFTNAQPISCRSAGATGVVTLTLIASGT